jgi:hypothetical protein
LDIYVDLLGTATPKYSIPVNKEKYEDYDHEDRENRDYAGSATTPTTIIIVSHGAAPYRKLLPNVRGQNSEGGFAAIVTTRNPARQSRRRVRKS